MQRNDITQTNFPFSMIPHVVSNVKENHHFKFIGNKTGDLRKRPPVESIIDGIVFPKNQGVLVAPSGVGKTFMALHLGYACATASKFANRFQVNHPLNVAYICGEGFDGIANRIAAAETQFQYDDNIHGQFYVVDSMPNMGDKSDVKTLINDMTHQDMRPGVVIVDTLHTAMPDHDDNKNQDIGIVYKHSKLIRDAFGCVLIFVHHVGKNGDIRGATAIRSDADFVFTIKTNGNHKLLTFNKIREARAPEDIEFELIENNNSLIVNWIPENKIAYSSVQMQYFQEIIKVLCTVKEKWFSVAEISKLIADEENTQSHRVLIARHLKTLCKDGYVLYNSEISPSNGKKMDFYKYYKNMP